ncbi:MAG: isochorismatase family protein [Tissierella sp.]|uniref:isochorismatase family protein n=1 Tax=Tissierella sp. TaxID=41274 RepID=UPI003F9B2F6F
MEKFRLKRENSLMFVVDIQERLVPAMKDGERVIKNTITLLESAHTMNINVIATEQYPKGLGSTVGEIKRYIDDKKTFTKIEFSGCIDEVRTFLQKSDKKDIILVGMETHVCVYQTTRDLIELGYNVFIVKDAVSSRTEENVENGLDLLKEMGAIITNTETVLFDLLGKAGTDEFKTISKLIK